MKEDSNIPELIYEETKAIKFFICLFYLIAIFFDALWYDVLPHFSSYNKVKINEGLGYWIYILYLSIIPFAIFFIKRNNPYPVKYLIFGNYIFWNTVNSIIRYLGHDTKFAFGNFAELLIIIFSPIFVNKKFHWVVSLVIIGKYIFLAALLQTTIPLSPAVLIICLSVITFIILNRFESYLKALSEVYEEIRQKEKLALIGQMATMIGHEIRNPIASLKEFIQMQKESYPESNDYYQIMIQEVDRINLIVNDLTLIGKPRSISNENASITEIINYSISVIQPQAKCNKVKIVTKVDEQLPPLKCDINQLKQVFLNIIKNAIEAMPDGGNIIVTVTLDNKTHIFISIEDEGCGVPQKSIKTLGTPFFTTKKEGTGLGLMVSKQIINDHNGEIKIESQEGIGTKVIVKLPVKQK
ncbi:ATP-binding protein [Bacillus sp. JJ1764]|uniref:ATP-binding protein n=1 Tax=Bacillus sp. JJ1764 TaxID=3122964 RepID=UPI002FFFD95B